MRPVRRALLSVSNKDGLIEFAQALQRRGVALLSTGGTATLLERSGVPVTQVSSRVFSAAAITPLLAASEPSWVTVVWAIHGALPPMVKVRPGASTAWASVNSVNDAPELVTEPTALLTDTE